MPIKIKSTSGSVTLDAQNVSGDQTLTIPSLSGGKTLLTSDGDGSGLTGVGVAGISSSSSSGTAISISSGNAVEMPVGTLEVSATSPDVILDKGVSGTATLHFYKAGAVSNYIKSTQYEDMKIGTETGTTIQFLPAGNTGNLTLTADRGLSQFTAKAWVYFDGDVSSPSINDSHNIYSIGDLGTGFYSIGITNAMANTNYAVFTDSRNAHSRAHMESNGTTSTRMQSLDTGHSPADSDHISVLIFGD